MWCFLHVVSWRSFKLRVLSFLSSFWLSWFYPHPAPFKGFSMFVMVIPSFQLLRSLKPQSSLFSFFHPPHTICADSLPAHHLHSISLVQVTVLLLLNYFNSYLIRLFHPLPPSWLFSTQQSDAVTMCQKMSLFLPQTFQWLSTQSKILTRWVTHISYFSDFIFSTLTSWPESLYPLSASEVVCADILLLNLLQPLLKCHILQRLSLITLFERDPCRIPHVPLSV